MADNGRICQNYAENCGRLQTLSLNPTSSAKGKAASAEDKIMTAVDTDNGEIAKMPYVRNLPQV